MVERFRALSLGGKFVAVVVAIFVFTVVQVAVTRFVPFPATSLMVLRVFQGHGIDVRWRSLDDISPNLPVAAIASEDGQFCRHSGFDFEAMQKALRHNERWPKKVRGGSTISQQTAKNAFLWPNRDVVRKSAEAYYTFLIEHIWGKRRIMEVYLNIVEWAPGVYGAEAASQHWFGVSARDLTPTQAAKLVAILPDPLKWKAEGGGRYVQGRVGHILGAMGEVRADGFAECVRR